MPVARRQWSSMVVCAGSITCAVSRGARAGTACGASEAHRPASAKLPYAK
ncbi:MAG: hypothetical protein F9K20_00600 [Hyphomicrobium sp.]|nr:MAG: hypothetical protein F9K20_00600 [Hyphomicrobium sp.]